MLLNNYQIKKSLDRTVQLPGSIFDEGVLLYTEIEHNRVQVSAIPESEPQSADLADTESGWATD